MEWRDNPIQFKFGPNRSARLWHCTSRNQTTETYWWLYIYVAVLSLHTFFSAFDKRMVVMPRRHIPYFISFGLRKGTNTYPSGSMNWRSSYGLLTFSFRQWGNKQSVHMGAKRKYDILFRMIRSVCQRQCLAWVFNLWLDSMWLKSNARPLWYENDVAIEAYIFAEFFSSSYSWNEKDITVVLSRPNHRLSLKHRILFK